jgi:hypothetical protein
MIDLCGLTILIGAIATACAEEAKPAHPVMAPVENLAASVLTTDIC